MILFLKKVLLGIAAFIMISACAPTSSAQRYGSKKEVAEQQKKSTPKKNAKTNSKRVTAPKVEEALPDSTEEEFDEAPPQESIIDRKEFIANYKNYINPDVPLGFREEILLQVIKYLETPYKYGGNTENGIDCSGFTLQVFEKSTGIKLPRSAREQFAVGEKVEREDLAFGDLVFFNTRRRSNPGHVGIYIGDDQFIHSSTSLGVTISSLQEAYYKKRYVGARRVDEAAE